MPRSGSTLLCDLLRQTGVSGAPASFFRAQSMANFSADWGIPAQRLEDFDQSYIDSARQHGCAGGGRFGMRIMWDNMPGLLARLTQIFRQAATDRARLELAFGPLQFIHLYRRDQVAEAVSYTIAEQTGLWHRHADGTERERVAPPAEPIYDAGQIRRNYDIVTKGHEDWLRWFAGENIDPHRLFYEDLADDLVAALRGVLRSLNLDPTKADHLRPGTARLADSRNAEWAARFRAETGLAPASTEG